jgi:hypothetical protein
MADTKTSSSENMISGVYMMPKVRCSNCEKSVDRRLKDGKTIISIRCRATGERIALSAKNPSQRSPYYQIRKCGEFLPRREYIDQFENPLDKAVELIEKGKRVKDILS